eukprot:6823811-Prymnesium_polylepis.1
MLADPAGAMSRKRDHAKREVDDMISATPPIPPADLRHSETTSRARSPMSPTVAQWSRRAQRFTTPLQASGQVRSVPDRRLCAPDQLKA